MGVVQKKLSRQYKHKVSAEEKLDRDLKDCMHCKFFWGNNHRCAINKCCKENQKIVEKKEIPDKCVGCPYKQSNDYCFPCMKDILGRK